LDQEITWVNDAFTDMTGYNIDEVLGKNPFDLLNGSDSDKTTIELLKNQIKNNELITQNTLFHKKNGSTYWSRITGQPMYDEIGMINQYFVIQEDITIRKLAKLDLQDSEKRYRALFHSNPQPMFIYDKATFKFKEVNESAINTYGYSSDEFNSMTMLDIFEELDKQNFVNNDDKVNDRNNLLLKSEIKNEEYIHHTKEGKLLNIEMVRNEIVLSGKETILVIIDDVTNKRIIEKELRRSNERFLIASKAVSDIIWEWDVRKNKYIWGDGIVEGFGYKTEDEYPTAENFKDFIHPDDSEVFFKNYISLIKNKNENYWNAEYRFKKKDGSYANVVDKAYVIRTSKGIAVKIIGALRDVTEEKNHESEKAKLIEQTQEFERKRFSMELHDGLAQQLIVLNLYLSQFDEGEPVNPELLKNCFDVVKASLNQTRSMCYNLTPPELENGLLLALKAMFDRLKTLNAMDFIFEYPSSLTNNDFENVDVYNLYRIIQEFVNNSIKHAQGSKIECTISKNDTHLEVNLLDNGVGFDHALITNGLGLNNIEKRAKLANVECYLTSEINEGTHLKIII
jgi:PAS domain S-box-containing protein